MEAVAIKPKCRRCNNELTKDETRNCMVCLVCYPNALKAPETPLPAAEKKEFLDVKTTKSDVIALIKELVPDIVRDELENWHIPKPPVTKDETQELVEDIKTEANKIIVKENWRAKAKALNISLYHKTKEKVLAEIAEKTKSPEEG